MDEFGPKWLEIAARLPGRTDHAARNRYHRLQRCHRPADALAAGGGMPETLLNGVADTLGGEGGRGSDGGGDGDGGGAGWGEAKTSMTSRGRTSIRRSSRCRERYAEHADSDLTCI